MKRFRNHLFVAAGLVVLYIVLAGVNSRVGVAQGPGVLQVKVVNMPADAVPTRAQGTTTVRNAEEPGRQPFQQSFTASFLDLPGGSSTAFPLGIVVPPGKRLVLRQVTGNFDMPSPAFVRAVGLRPSLASVTPSYFIRPVLQGTLAGTRDFFTVNETVLFYLNPGDAPILDFLYGSAPVNNACTNCSQMSFTLIGYFVDVP